jgi:hypothetical protein
LGLEVRTGVFVAAGDAGEGAEVAVEFDGGEGGVGGGVEGVDVWWQDQLCDILGVNYEGLGRCWKAYSV